MKYSIGTKMIAVLLLAGMALSSLVACKGGSGSETTGSNQTEGTTDMNEIVNDPNITDVQQIGSLTRQAAADGMVLLKNDGKVLPLTSDRTVAIFGKGQIDTIKGGTGSGDVIVNKTVSLLEGLEQKEKEGKVKIYADLAAQYKKNSNYEPSTSELKTIAANVDTAIYVITRNSGEGGDRSTSSGDYYLSSQESRMLRDLNDAGFKKVVVVLNIGGMTDTTKILSYSNVKGILLAWQPGQEAGHAIADILVGDVTPSGKLADTFAASYSDYPSSKNFNEDADYVEYTEDIYVGYRYFETFDPNYEKVNFEFGFGLSYTTFEFSDLKITEEDGKIVVKVKVTNTGSYNGKEVVQVYYSAPVGKLGNPAKELAAFAKTDTLVPGGSQELTMSFDINDMASYDDTGKVQKSAYVLEAGDYNIYVGNSIRNAGEAGIRYTYKVNELTVVEQLTEHLTAKLLDERLVNDGSGKETYEDVYATPDNMVTLTDGLVKIEAENYYDKHRHADVTFNGDGTLSGIKINSSGDGNRYITYAVEAPEAGDYVVKVGYGYATNGDQSDVICYFVNGKAQGSWMHTIVKTGTYWETQETEGATLKLEKGINLVKIMFKDGITVVADYVTFAPAGSAAAAASAPLVETADEASAVVAASSATSQASSEKIKFKELARDPSLMDQFLDQLTVNDLIELLHGRSGSKEDTYSDTGIIGGLTDLGIPYAQTADGPAGIRMKSMTSTAYPIETLLACTWDTDMLYKVGEAIAKDAKKFGVDIWLAPAVNIHRNPLTGRNFEYYSEDPYLAGMMASAIVSGVQDNGVGVMLKHFVANEKETNRVYSDTRATERALREIYLRPFQIAIENANPWVIMTSYNKINGTYAAENKELLTNILRDEWGFDGLVSSDWWNTSVAFKELLAGENLKMKTVDSGNQASVLGAYNAGILTREDLERNAQKVLEVIIKAYNNR